MVEKGQLKTLSFYQAVTKRSELSLSSPRINTPFKLLDITATFADGIANLLELRFFLSPDNHTPTTGKPTGISLLRDYGQVEYLVGNDTKKVIRHEVEQPEGGSYLKVYGNNTDFFDHVIDVQMTIELMERK